MRLRRHWTFLTKEALKFGIRKLALISSEVILWSFLFFLLLAHEGEQIWTYSIFHSWFSYYIYEYFWSSHLIQFGLLTGEREGEAQWKLFILYAQLVQEISQTLGYVVK